MREVANPLAVLKPQLFFQNVKFEGRLRVCLNPGNWPDCVRLIEWFRIAVFFESTGGGGSEMESETGRK